MNKDIENLAEHINRNYLSLLESFVHKDIDESNAKTFIDEIRIFWVSHKRNALFVLKYVSEKRYDTCFFTNAAGIALKDHEYEPFIACSRHKIYDDKLPLYFEILGQGEWPDIAIQEIKYLIENTVSLLKLSMRSVIILPFGLLVEKDGDELKSMTNRLFLQLFPSIKSIDEFFEAVRNEDDYIKYVDEKTASAFRLSNSEGEDDISSLSKVKKVKTPPFQGLSFAQRVFFAFSSVIFGAVVTLFYSTVTGFVPYLRNAVAFNNALLLFDSFIEHNERLNGIYPGFAIRLVLLRCFYSYVDFNNSDLNTLVDVIEKEGFVYFSDYVDSLGEELNFANCNVQIAKELISEYLSFSGLNMLGVQLIK